MSGGFYDLSTTGGVAKTLFLDGKGLRHSPKSKSRKQDASKQTVWWTICYCQWIYLDENKISWCDGRLLLWLVLRCDGRLLLWLDGDQTRMRGQISKFWRISNFKALSVWQEKTTWVRCLVSEDRPYQSFFGRAKNLIGFSCQEKSFFVCWSQIRSPQNSTSTIWPFYSTVITPHRT